MCVYENNKGDRKERALEVRHSLWTFALLSCVLDPFFHYHASSVEDPSSLTAFSWRVLLSYPSFTLFLP